MTGDFGDMFCERCGRNLKDEEYVCPECGKQCRVPPMQENQFQQGNQMFGQVQPINLADIFKSKYFLGSLACGLVAGFAVTYIWRFTFLMFCIPLFIPMGGRGIGLGLMIGMSIGCVAAMLAKAFIII